MIVLALTKVPASLRGDLTKWCQEIQTGVYVGNPNAKIRDLLWERVVENIGFGQATMAYNTNNELGYAFRTTDRSLEVEDLEGIPLIKHLNQIQLSDSKHGFSKAYKFHQVRKFNRPKSRAKVSAATVAIDIETTGLNLEEDEIISIGAVKLDEQNKSEYYSLIKTNHPLSQGIAELTGLSNKILNAKGKDVSEALSTFENFIGKAEIIGYNVQFDLQFLNKTLDDHSFPILTNSYQDLLRIVKRKDKFLDNYRLETVLKKYGIVNEHPHNALSDAIATLDLAVKLNENGDLSI